MSSRKLGPACPCGSGKSYVSCCQLLHHGEPAADAEGLMRSRYSAYVLGLADYLRGSWHPSTRPARLDMADNPRWLGLKIKHHVQHSDSRASVEFVARYFAEQRAHRLHEISRFEKVGPHWTYLDGKIQ